MDSDQGKLFVGGISWETNEEILKDHFKQYGEVLDAVIMRDRNTGSARGFGFVVFSDSNVADKALQEKHVIAGRTVEVKKAVPRGEQQNSALNKNNNNSGTNSNNNGTTNSTSQFRTKKIFVGGLSANLTENEFRSYFEKFGRITDVVVMYDSATHRPRGFGFITFDSEDAVENVMQESFHHLNNKRVEVKRAVPKDGSQSQNRGQSRSPMYSSFNNNAPIGVYPSYTPRYGVYPGYGHVSTYLNTRGGYPAYYAIGGYGGIPQAPYGPGFANGPPVGPPRSPWNGATIVGPRQCPAPFTNAVYGYGGDAMGGYGGHHGYVKAGGYVGMGGYGGMMAHGNGNHNQGASPRVDGGKFEENSNGYGGAARQNQRGQEQRFRPYADRVA
ncbi:hypothetical protein AMTRI_Chr12g238820 [Amborella trichopoda]|uniref:RRM domain-containing protein n=1 Tax=Amborella trichopoda TaxID=13333 RepID=U5CYZ7_AMBTC|nr:heterogeneous nuclear ribonucleoprotein 1 [Amborella trichopoda]ERN18541.1 hypothetical protein AMTR_s00065p00083440 [Amborella trichopoda]|eukprot:XP_006857074.1 heterogeneous nuclear ribonucleoprotein 1 [Amborella trichopoda]